MPKKEVFSETRMFAYNKARKIAFGIAVVLSIVLIVSVITSYLLMISSPDFEGIVFINRLAAHVTSHIGSSTLLGVFYSALIGGLFFVVVPLEIFLTKFMNSGQSFIAVTTFYMIGILVSYSIDYFIGLKMSTLAKKLISPRKFYGVKGKINKYGAIAIYVFNVFILPSQILAVILGVFKYNKTRFYIFFLLGQLTKCIIIAMGISYISG